MLTQPRGFRQESLDSAVCVGTGGCAKCLDRRPEANLFLLFFTSVVFIYGLFYYAFSIADFISSSGRMIDYR